MATSATTGAPLRAMNHQLEDKVFLIAGGSSGLRKALSQKLAPEGFRVNEALIVHTRSRLPLLCLAMVLVVLLLTGCGDAGKSSSASTAIAPGRLPPRDGDGDIDSLGMGRYDTDNDADPTFGPAASPLEHEAIATLLKRYYDAAAADDGALACTLLDPLVAEAAVEEHRPGKGPPALRGRTCAQVLTKLFAQHHRELVEEAAALRVGWAQTKDQRATVLADFGPTRERLVLVHRAHGTWQMDALLENEAW